MFKDFTGKLNDWVESHDEPPAAVTMSLFEFANLMSHELPTDGDYEDMAGPFASLISYDYKDQSAISVLGIRILVLPNIPYNSGFEFMSAEEFKTGSSCNFVPTIEDQGCSASL